jgi:carboxypeptidase Taq
MRWGKKMQKQIETLQNNLKEIHDLAMASQVLMWDSTTKMPEKAATGRARMSATLAKMIHQKETSPELGALIEKLVPHTDILDADSFDARLVKKAKRDFDRKARVTEDWTSRFSEHSGVTYQKWAEAKEEKNFAKILPYMEKTLELSREYSEFFPNQGHIADPLISESDFGVSAQSVKTLFADLRKELVPFVEKIGQSNQVDDKCLHQPFEESEQLAFGKEVITQLGYDFSRGRQDKTHHPFMVRFDADDVRITTRVNPNFLGEALFSSIHEAGHAMYELGIDRKLDGLPLGHGTSSGVHESQSRLWENVVGRSLPMWKHFYPSLQKTFPTQLAGVDLDSFYKAINKVDRSLIRTDADEVTYNLHIMIRFDLECDMLEGKLAIKDLPDAWNARYQSDLGVTPPNDSLGCMQDIHWFYGLIGGSFQGYTLGNILNAQFFAAATKAHPDIYSEIEKGEFGTLRTWLRENIHTYGAMFDADEVVKRSTGEPMSIKPFMDYLNTKYSAIYGI